MSEKRCNNILVRGVNWIGDAVMTMPALRSLKLADSDSKITLLIKPWVFPLFEKDPNVDEIILYKDKYKGIMGRIQLAKKLKKSNFCMAVFFQNAIDAAIIAFLARIPERIGYSRDGRRVLLTKPVPFNNHAKRLHHIEYYLNMLNKTGFVTEYSLPWIYLSLDERLEARDRLKDLKRPVVAINPGAAYGSSKRWHTERFAELSKKVIDEINGSVVILGGPSEIGIAEDIYKKLKDKKLRNWETGKLGSWEAGKLGSWEAGKLGSWEAGKLGKGDAYPHSFSTSQLLSFPHSSSPISHFLNMAGRTSLRELVSVISECDLLVTNDSGPMHIGYAVGTPVVAIFGSTAPELTGPVGNGNMVIRREVDCAPCFERECRNRDLKCMDIITSDEVFEAVKKLLNPKKAVFFDRDGTLCKDVEYLSRIEDLEIFPAVKSIVRLKEKGFSLIGVSNQSGIARGLINKDFVKQVNSIFIERYGFDGFYYCPHHPDEHCSCRKPEIRLLLDARVDHKINLKESFVVGDKELDMLLAKAVGAKGILVKTGQDSFSVHADFIVKDIEEAVSVILNDS